MDHLDVRLHLTRQFWMLFVSLILPGNDADGRLHASLELLCIWVWTGKICKYTYTMESVSYSKFLFFRLKLTICFDLDSLMSQKFTSSPLGYILPDSAWLCIEVLTLSGNDAFWGLHYQKS